MENQYIMSTEDVLSSGVLFDGDEIHWGGEYGQQVCRYTKNGLEEPVTGLLYEVRNGNIDYYCFYKNGVPNGPNVVFYENGKVKKYSEMVKGVLHGKVIHWNAYDRVCFAANYRFGIVISFSEWDDEGVLINEQLEPTAENKRRLEQHEAIEQRMGEKSIF